MRTYKITVEVRRKRNDAVTAMDFTVKAWSWEAARQKAVAQARKRNEVLRIINWRDITYAPNNG